MSQTIDERVVEMRFDNKQFESGVATTMTTLQKLKNSLNFSKIGDSFDVINKASNKVDMSGLDRAISGVQSKFSALEVVAITALSNITNSILNSAKQWVSAFTIDPIKSGFQEYETQINAVQTILANTQKEGTNIQDVNKALDELNLYADKTIYNFTEMTRNIGTFTAAGVDLKTSTNAIQGIANIAAVSGSNSQQASTAMYQLSQALAAGAVKLQDWNSVVNAGMGGQLFQDALRETSELLGTGAEAAIKAEGSFRESLKKGWLTSEVLTETLKKFTTSGAVEYVAKYTGLTKEMVQSEWDVAKSLYGETDAIDKAAESLAKKSGKNASEIAETLQFAQTAEDAATKVKTFSQLIDTLKEAVQSGWSQSFRIIVGDFEDAKKLFTEISDSFGAVISASADARNKLLAEAFGKQGYKEYISSVVGVRKEAVEELQTVAKTAGTASDIFKESLNTFTNGDETMNNVVTHLIDVANSQEDVISHISDMTGMKEESIRELQKLGQEAGYASDEFKDFALSLAEGDPEMVNVITHLLEMNDAIQVKPSGRELLIDSFRNALKGLLSILTPIKEAFREVFPPTTAEQLYSLLEGFHEFTKGLILSDKSSESLKKAFKGLFDIAKLLRDGFMALLKAILPIEKPVSALGGGILTLAGSFGGLLSSFADTVRSSELVQKAFEYLGKGSAALMSGLSNLIKIAIDFVMNFSKMEGTVKVVNAVYNAFEKLATKATSYIETFVDSVKDMIKSLFDFEDISVDGALQGISNAFSKLADGISGFSLDTLGDAFDTLKQKIKSFTDLLMSNEGLGTFVENFKKYGEELKDSFTLDNLLARMERVMDVFGKFFNWIKNTLAPVFEGFNATTAIGGAGALGLVYALVKMTNAFDKIADSLGSIPDLLGSVKDTLTAYQTDLKAEAILKVSAAIAVLAGALVLLSFTDTDRVMEASKALSLIAVVLLGGITALMDALNKGKQLNDAMRIFSKGLSSTMKKFGRAMEIRAAGTAVKKFAESIAIIAASIIALGIMYNKDKDALMAGVKLVELIGIAMVGIMAGMSILGNVLKGGGMVNFSKAALGILSLSASLSLCVAALSKLFKMEFPSDWQFKLGVLVSILGGLGVLAIALGASARLSGGAKTSATTILAMATFLMVTIVALDKLFKMEFPSDWQEKLTVLGLVFAGFGTLMVTMGVASKLAGGAIKSAGTILSMAVFVGVVVAALMVLSIIPGDKLLKGATALGLVLLALGGALLGASKVTNEETNKAVLTMAIAVGAIAASLVFLSFIKFSALLKAATALGSILLVLAVDLNAASKNTNAESWISIMAMIASVLAITYSLVMLSEQPWQGMLAGAASLSAVLLSMGVAMGIIGAAKPNLIAIASFLTASASIGLIALSIYELSKQPWEGLLAAAAALSVILLSMSAAMGVCALVGSVAPAALVGIALLDTFIANFALMLMALGKVYQSEEAQVLMSGGIEFLKQLGLAIGEFVGAILNGVLSGISSALPQIGSDLSEFMTNLQPFISGSKNIDAGALASVGFLAAIIVALTAAEIINGIASLFGLSLVDVAVELSKFMIELQPFIEQSRNLKEDVMRACGYLATMIITLTAAELLAGISKFLGIGGSIAEFGKELADFGPHIKKFSEDVKDVRAESVQGAASAAEIMANMANKLPGTGGLMQKIFGEKSLSEFGKELVKFGPAIKQFGDQVKDVRPEAVQGAASAAEIMANLATKLPAQGGLVQKLFGEKSLSEFGKELVKFGPDIAKFADQVKDVNPAAVAGVATITTIMSNLANNLPSSQTLWDKIFGGGQVTLSKFGEELVKFGGSMSNFSTSISGVNPEKVSGVVLSFKELVDLATGIQGVSAESLVSFSNQLSQIGVDSVDKFVQAFTDAGPKAINAVNTLLNAVISALTAGGSTIQASAVTVGSNLCAGLQTGITSKQGSVISTETSLTTTMINTLRNGLPVATFNTIAQNAIQGIITGMNSKKPLALSTVKNLCTSIINQFRTSLPMTTFNTIGQNVVQGIINGINAKKPLTLSTVTNLCLAIINKFRTELKSETFKTFGENVVNWFVEGMRSKASEVDSAVQHLCSSVVEAFRNNLSESTFVEIGENAALGLKRGIENKIDDIADAAIRAAREAVREAKNELDEHSPSRVMEEVGEFFSLGMVRGILNKLSAISSASTEAAKEAIDPVKKVVDGITSIIDSGDFNTTPVIRPVMDLTDVQNGVNEIGMLMNRSYDLSSVYNRTMDVASTFNRNRKAAEETTASEQKPVNGNNYEFIQNNYSPKALSRSEIYRQTNNQFSAFKRAVNPA